MAVVERLAGRHTAVGVATHDAMLASDALTLLAASGTPCELEVLYGRPMRSVLRVARQLEVPVRVYVPFGHAYLDYAAEYARKHPLRVVGWLVRDLLPSKIKVRDLAIAFESDRLASGLGRRRFEAVWQVHTEQD